MVDVYSVREKSTTRYRMTLDTEVDSWNALQLCPSAIVSSKIELLCTWGQDTSLSVLLT